MLWKYCIVLITASAAYAAEEDLATIAARANAAMQSRNYPEAEREYRLLVTAAPKMAEAYTNLGLSRYLQREYPAAIEAFEHGLKLQPQMANAWLFLGISQFNLNRPAQALTALKRFIALRPDDFQGQYYAGLCLLSLNRNREAAGQLANALKIDARNVDGWYHLAQSNLRMAEAHVHERGSRGPDPVVFAEFQKSYENAVAEITAIDPGSFRIRQLKAGYYQATGDDKKAMDELHELVSSDLKVTGLNYTLGCLYLKDRDYDHAISAFESELRLAAPFPRTYLQLGHAWIGKDEPERAMPFLARAATEEPESGVPWVEKGRAETKMGRYDDAIHSFRKAIELKEEKSSVHYLLGTAYRKAGQLESARVEFQRSQQLAQKGNAQIPDGPPEP